MTKQAISDLILHYGIIRMRVQGSGNLLQYLISLGGVNTYTLIPFTLTTTTNKEMTRLVNVTEQKCQFELKTTAINEVFNISRILIFAKAVATEYPG